MPLGPYETFQECVTDQMKKYREKNQDWSEEKLKEVAGGICNKIEENTEQGSTYRYLASIHTPYEFQGEHYAKIRLIDTSTSLPSEPKGVCWRVTYEGLKKAVQKLMKNKYLPLLGDPKKGHNATKQIGETVTVDMPNGYTDITYRITDPEAWKNIQEKKWLHVSPQVRSRNSRKGLSNEVVLDDFDFEHCAFVEEGAFPQAVVQQLWDAEMLHKLRAELF